MAKLRRQEPHLRCRRSRPSYDDYHSLRGISVDEYGKQHYLDVHVAYRQACLNAIEYLTKFGYSKAQAYAILGTAYVQRPHQRRRRHPQRLCHALVPTQIFDFDIAHRQRPASRQSSRASRCRCRQTSDP